jgi:hypothetical protein
MIISADNSAVRNILAIALVLLLFAACWCLKRQFWSID